MTVTENRRVLLVDDDSAVLTVSKLLLSRSGFVVDAAPSAERALELLSTKNYSAILSDINMEGMSGLDLLRKIYTAIGARAAVMPKDKRLFVNVHPPDLLDPSLHSLGSPLAPYADRVVLEITERVSIERMGDISGVVRALRILRYRLAVDDLGTGYAGLASFTQLSPDFVKLDRSLVAGIDASPVKRRVVKAMTALCADLGMQVICEGVETVPEKEALIAIGADLLQGYLFGRPAAGFEEPQL